MNLNSDEKREELMEAYASLPPDVQKAVMWLVQNYHPLEKMCKAGPLTEESRMMFEKLAIERDDVWLLALVKFERAVNARE